LQLKTKIVRFYTANSKPVKQEVDGTVILLPLVFPAGRLASRGKGAIDGSILMPIFLLQSLTELKITTRQAVSIIDQYSLMRCLWLREKQP
jgi:hypothetical protein